MGKRETGPQVIRRSAREVFAFLNDAGLAGPLDTEHGVEYLGRGLRIDISFVSHHQELYVSVGVDLLADDGSRQGGTHLKKLCEICGVAEPRGVGGWAGNARLVALRVRGYAPVLEALLPHVLQTDRETLLRYVARGFAAPDLRLASRLNSDLFDGYQDMPFRHRLDGLVDRVVFEYRFGTADERLLIRAALTRCGAWVLHVWADRWERVGARSPHPPEVSMAGVARELAAAVG